MMAFGANPFFFFDGCLTWGSAGLGERGESGTGPGRAVVVEDAGKGMEELQWLLVSLSGPRGYDVNC